MAARVVVAEVARRAAIQEAAPVQAVVHRQEAKVDPAADLAQVGRAARVLAVTVDRAVRVAQAPGTAQAAAPQALKAVQAVQAVPVRRAAQEAVPRVVPAILARPVHPLAVAAAFREVVDPAVAREAALTTVVRQKGRAATGAEEMIRHRMMRENAERTRAMSRFIMAQVNCS